MSTTPITYSVPVPVNFWTATQPKHNLGDYITSYLLQRFGVPHYCFEYGSPRFGEPWSHVFRSVMTTLDPCAGMFWGTGYAGEAMPCPDPNAQWFAARGPYTRDRMSLPADTPTGDPAMLLPYLIPPSGFKCGPTYIPHCLFEQEARQRPLPAQCTRMLSMWVTPEQFEARVKGIAASEVVFTSSLHAMLIAHAYGVPAYLHIQQGEKQNLPRKWDDANHIQMYGCDLHALVEAFPFPIDPTTRTLLP